MPTQPSVDAAELLDLADPETVVATPTPTWPPCARAAPMAWHSGMGDLAGERSRRGGRGAAGPTPGPGLRARARRTDDWDTFNWLHADSILDSEPPKHTRLRRLVAGAFGRGHVPAARAPRIEELAAGLLADLPGRRVRRHRGLCRAVAGPRDRRAARRPRGRPAPPAAVVPGDRADVRGGPDRRRRGGGAGGEPARSRHTSRSLPPSARRRPATTC